MSTWKAGLAPRFAAAHRVDSNGPTMTDQQFIENKIKNDENKIVII